MKFRKILAIFILPIFIIACKKETKKIVENKFLFGTYINITVYDSDENKAHKAINLAFDEIARIDNKYNSKIETSLISKLNNHEIETIPLDNEGKYLFENLQNAYNVSGKTYDVTIEPILEVWNFGLLKRDSVPLQKDLEKARENVDFSKVKLENNILSYENNNIKIDTGSFLKGYAVEAAKKILVEQNINSAFISSISSIETIGTKPNGKEWRIGVENPNNSKEILGVVKLNNEAMGVSGDYQTYLEINGKRYHHIIDKRTCYPVTHKKMVVVIAENAFICDMYSTAFFTMSISEISKFAKLNNLKVLVVDSNMKIYNINNVNFQKK